MVVQGECGAGGVTGEREAQDLPVFVGLPRPGRVGGPGHGRHESGLVAYLVEHPRQHRVAAGEVQLAVERPVGQGPFGLVDRLVGPEQGVAGGVQRRVPGQRAP